MRITGMASGMDIDKMVSDLMKAERIPQDKLRQKKQLLTYQTQLYREVNTKMAALRDALNNIRYSSQMTGFKATSSSADVSVNPGSSTAPSNHTVEVTGLAEGAVISGSKGVTNFGLTGTAVSGATIDSSNNKFILTVDNSAKTITLPDGVYDSAGLQAELQKQIDKSFGAGTVTVGNSGGALSLTPAAKGGYTPQLIVNASNGALGALGFTDGQSYRFNTSATLQSLADSGKLSTNIAFPGSFTITGNGGTPVTISYDATDTLQSIMNKVNSSSANATMNYDAAKDQFILKTRSIGASAQVSTSDTSGNFLAAIGIGDASSQGKDAVYTIDGISQTSDKNTVTTSDGATLVFNRVTTAPVNVSVAGDPSGVVDKIKKFVSAYNDMIELVNTRLSEQHQRGYDPLTDDQKSAMKDTDIANWEAKVKTGLLSNSPILREVKSSLRELFSKSVPGLDSAYDTLSEVGLTTLPYTKGQPADAGKLQIDEAKLTDAISKNPDAVNKLFTNNPGYESQEGIAVTMYNRVDNLLSSLMKEAGRVNGSEADLTTALGKQIVDLEAKINAFNDKLNKKEDDYYRRFSAMEQAVANGNAQLSWLSQQLG
ncbi:flagellar filament capping protein FliD [Paenibacillus sp. GCM10023250]|uniref:flagellar filament capping protein FliD n=1 Tax=Paenibacillus sp. GCM10023250 TaxID=3252648 RepID=UPI00361506BB